MADGTLRGVHKDVAKLLRQLRKEGWVIGRTGGDHLYVARGGHTEYISATPRNPRATLGALRRLTQGGNSK